MLVAGIVGLSAVILPIVLGLLFTCVLRPVAQWFGGRGVPPAIAAVLAVLLLTAALVGVVWLTVNAVVDQWPEIECVDRRGPEHVHGHRRGQRRIAETAATLDHGASDAVGEIVDLLFHGVVQFVPTIAGLIAAVVLSLLVTFFFLKDGPAMWRWIVARFDTRDGIVDQSAGGSGRWSPATSSGRPRSPPSTPR